MQLELTKHAQTRMQQRGIPQDIIEQLLGYGRMTHDHHGGQIVWFDRASRRRLQREFGMSSYRVTEKHLDAYVVLDSEGRVLTVGHRFKRIRQH